MVTLAPLKYLYINHGDQKVFLMIFYSSSAGTDIRNQILSSKDGPRVERVKSCAILVWIT